MITTCAVVRPSSFRKRFARQEADDKKLNVQILYIRLHVGAEQFSVLPEQPVA